MSEIFRQVDTDLDDADFDDVQGHMSPRPTGTHDLVTDDVEGRRFPAPTTGAPDDSDEDDVAGHVSLQPTDPKR